MDQRVQAAVSKPEEEASIEVRRLPHLIDGARVSTGDDRRALAFEINQVLVAMRTPGDEAAEARVLIAALDAHHLDGLVDAEGRDCRREAVETLITCGFPHALEVSPEDLVFARAWRPGAKPLETPWALHLQRSRRTGAAVVVGSEVLFGVMAVVMGPADKGTFAIPLLAALAALAAILASIKLATSPPKLDGQEQWGTGLVLCAIVQLLSAYAMGASALVGAVGIIVGLLLAFWGQAEPLSDPPPGP